MQVSSFSPPSSPLPRRPRQGPRAGGRRRFPRDPLRRRSDVCESRDPKGLYAKARAGQIKEFTGISSPYEAPEQPELKIDTGSQDLAESVDVVIKALQERGIIPAA